MYVRSARVAARDRASTGPARRDACRARPARSCRRRCRCPRHRDRCGFHRLSGRRGASAGGAPASVAAGDRREGRAGGGHTGRAAREPAAPAAVVLAFPRLPEHQPENEKTSHRIRRCVSMRSASGEAMRRNGVMRGSDVAAVRERVVAARMPGVAAGDAPHREPRAARCAMALDRLARVIGASRIEAAIGAEQRPKQVLIGATARRAARVSSPTRKSREQLPRFGVRRRDVGARTTRLTRRMMSNASIDGRARAHAFAQPAAQAIAIDGAPHHLATDDIADAAGGLRGGRGDQLQEMRVVPDAALEQRFEGARAAQPISERCRAGGRHRDARQTVRRARPLARRAARTLRPPTVFMRARKPCVRARRTSKAGKCVSSWRPYVEGLLSACGRARPGAAEKPYIRARYSLLSMRDRAS